MKLFVFPNLKKTNCRDYTVQACRILSENNVDIIMESKYSSVFSDIPGIRYGGKEDMIADCDYILAVGGDGTILKCSGLAAVHRKPMLGLNCGRLGFMATLEHSELELLKKFSNGEFTLDRRMMLDAEVVVSGGNESRKFTALNDVVLFKNSGCKIADFTVSKGGKVISSLRADGLIFSTPTGATAYSLSAGGPIIEPNMKCIEFTQICAHSLFARSMIFSADSVLEVCAKTSKNAGIMLNVDGNEVMHISDGDNIHITCSDSYVELIDIKGGSFFSSVNRKLMQPLKELPEDINI